MPLCLFEKQDSTVGNLEQLYGIREKSSINKKVFAAIAAKPLPQFIEMFIQL